MEIIPILEIEQKDGTFKTLVEKVDCKYRTYRLTPDRLIENGKQIEEFLKTLSALRKPSVSIIDKKVVIDSTMPIHYEILIEKGVITFNYVIPEKYDRVVTNKLRRTFPTATVKEIEDYLNRFENKFYCEFIQKKHFLFSLNTDYRENGFIDGIMGFATNVQDTVLIQISFRPLNDSWKQKWNNTYEKIREGKNVEVNTSVLDLVLSGGNKAIDSIFSITDMIMGVGDNSNISRRDYRGGADRYNREDPFKERDYSRNYNSGSWSKRGIGDRERTKMSNATTQKVNFDGFETQIRLYCDNDKMTYSYAKMLEGVFKILDDDQQITIGRVKKVKDIQRKIEYKVNKQIYSSKELAVLLQKPNRRMQREFKENLESIENVEVEIPKSLREKGIPIGKVKYKGENFTVYWPNDKHMAAMHKVITGLQRTGKSSYLANFAVEAIMKGDSVILIDTIKGCELANEIRDYMPNEYADKLVVLDFSDLDHLLPLAWNEITNSHDGSARDKLMKASYIAGNFEYFLETAGELKSETTRLSPRMKRYLSCACKVVFSIDKTNIKDVLDCLMSHDRREHFIRLSGINENSSTVQELRRLDDVDKHGNIVTKYSEISGIVDRASILFNDYMMELLLSTENNNKIDFKYWADNGYCVLIKMSELEFSRTTLKTLVTLVYSKIWLAMIARGKGDNHRQTHVILDEIHNFPQVTDMLKLNCREAAKYGLSYVFTSHLLIDLKSLLPFIKGSGANFMLFKTTKENYKLLEDELSIGGFELEDCLAVKDFHTINIVNYDRDYVVFMSKVVDPLPNRYPKIDRSYIDLICSKEYGVEFNDY